MLSPAGSAQILIPSARSAAALGGLDRFASVLASVSFFLGRPPLLAPIPRLSREIESWCHLPRLLLADAIAYGLQPPGISPSDGGGGLYNNQ
jgi:hypothetical protein